MQKIEFKNLPDETVPINAPNLNQIQDNVEQYIDLINSNISKKMNGQQSMGSIIVENIECKNLFDINTENATSNGTVGITSNQIVLSCSGAWAQTRFKKIKVKQGETYTLSFTVENPSANTVAIAIYKSDNSTKIANTPNYINTSFSEHLIFTANDTEIVIALVANNSSTTNTNSVTFSNIQLEKGNISTQFVEHKEFNNDRLLKDLNINAGTNPINWDDAYTENKILVYGIVNQASVPGKPKDSPKYGTLVSIQAHYKAQIYIPDYACDIGVFMRFGKEDWVKLAGTKIEKNT